MKKILFIWVSIFMLGVFQLGAQEEKPKLALTLFVQKEVKVQKDGAWVTERVPADKTTKNDVLLIAITYQNQGKTEARDASILDPVPSGTVYLMGSADGKGTEITFSVDNGKTFQRAPVKYLVKNKDGSFEEKIASANMHTHIQWTVKKPVQPGQSGTVSFKVTVK